MKPASRSETRADGIRIRLLGNLQVLRGGREELLPASKRTRALLGYLVALGKPRTRQHLCDLLWEGPDDPRRGVALEPDQATADREYRAKPAAGG